MSFSPQPTMSMLLLLLLLLLLLEGRERRGPRGKEGSRGQRLEGRSCDRGGAAQQETESARQALAHALNLVKKGLSESGG